MLKNVHSYLYNFAIDKELQQTNDFIFCVALFAFCFVFDKISSFVISNTYCVVFFRLHLVSCVPNVTSFSGLSILHCPFVFSDVLKLYSSSVAYHFFFKVECFVNNFFWISFLFLWGMVVYSIGKSNVMIDEKVRELKLSKFFSIRIWLMLLREYALSQYDCSPS